MSQLTKLSDRAGKMPDNLLLKGRGGGREVSFYLIKISHLKLSFTLLVLYFIHIFCLCDSYAYVFEPLRTSSSSGNASKNFIPFRSLNFELTQLLWRIRSYRFEQIEQCNTVLCESRSATIPRFNINYRTEELLIIFSRFEDF